MEKEWAGGWRRNSAITKRGQVDMVLAAPLGDDAAGIP